MNIDYEVSEMIERKSITALRERERDVTTIKRWNKNLQRKRVCIHVSNSYVATVSSTEI